MDYLFDDSRDDKNIEDYLFSGYKPTSKSTFDLDQQFAKPIQDEDLFGVDANDEILQANDDVLGPDLDLADKTSEQFDYIKDPFDGIRSEILCDKNTNSPGSIFEDEPHTPPRVTITDKSDNPRSELDEIFIDDYSNSSADITHPNTSNNENTCPEKSYSRPKPVPPPTPTQVKMQRMKESILEQAKAISNGPKKLGVGFEKDGVIELTIGHEQLVSNSNSKFIFNKLFNKSKKAADSNGSPENLKRSWAAQKDSLKKRICAQKRKIWDSFQQPTDAFDDEEELIEIPKEGDSKEKESVIEEEHGDGDQKEQLNDSNDEDDGNFEDLEREERGSSDGEEDFEAQDDHDLSFDEEEAEIIEDDDDEVLGIKTNISDEQESVHGDVSEASSSEQDEILDANGDSNDDIDSVVNGIESDTSELEDETNNNFSLDLDEDSDSNSEKIAKRKRRAIFIDDEASEDD